MSGELIKQQESLISGLGHQTNTNTKRITSYDPEKDGGAMPYVIWNTIEEIEVSGGLSEEAKQDLKFNHKLDIRIMELKTRISNSKPDGENNLVLPKSYHIMQK